MTFCDGSSSQDGKLFWGHEEFDAACLSRRSPDESELFELKHHVMDGGWCDPEMAPHVGLGGRLAVQAFVGVDEGQILALLVGEADRHGLSTGL